MPPSPSAYGSAELNPGERSDISWITTGSVDRTQEVVIAKGMNDNQFAANPLVTLQHAYNLPPVGKSLWRKRGKDGDHIEIKVKTQYPAKPESWASGDPWVPDNELALVQAGLLNGKSIGFLPLKVHFADAKSREKNQFSSETLFIDEWLFLEYAVCFLPADFLRTIGVDPSPIVPKHAARAAVPFTPLSHSALCRARLALIDPHWPTFPLPFHLRKSPRIWYTRRRPAPRNVQASHGPIRFRRRSTASAMLPIAADSRVFRGKAKVWRGGASPKESSPPTTYGAPGVRHLGDCSEVVDKSPLMRQDAGSAAVSRRPVPRDARPRPARTGAAWTAWGRWCG